MKYAPLITPPKPMEPEKKVEKEPDLGFTPMMPGPVFHSNDKFEVQFIGKGNRYEERVFTRAEIEQALREIGEIIIPKTGPKTPEEEQLDTMRQVFKELLNGGQQHRFIPLETAIKYSPTIQKELIAQGSGNGEGRRTEPTNNNENSENRRKTPIAIDFDR